MSAYYNDNDPYAAAWLRNLVSAGLIPAGDVDERSIADVDPADLDGYGQCHFFAGIGGWPYALDLAGWPSDRPVWTGSCPCQPFSSAGKQGGSADERHLWPQWFRLIRECRPDTIFGEQVAGAVGFGWIDRVFADLEALGYACGAAVLGAHSVGAPHIRQRLFWVADSQRGGSRTRSDQDARQGLGQFRAGWGGAASGVADANRDGPDRGDEPVARTGPSLGSDRETLRQNEGGGVAAAEHAERRALDIGRKDGRDGPDVRWAQVSRDCGLGLAQTLGHRWPEEIGRETQYRPQQRGAVSWLGEPNQPRSQGRREHAGEHAGQRSAWASGKFLQCLDGKARLIEPSIFPLAHGVPARVGRLRAYGNAIVPQGAAEFIRAVMEAL